MLTDKIWLIIVNWNGLSHLQYCIPSLLKSDLGDANILVVDNASSDESHDYLCAQKEGNGRLEILRLSENRGWAGGNNEGIRYAVASGAEIVVLLNNDMKFSMHWLKGITQVFESQSRVGVVGCHICHTQERFSRLSSTSSGSNDFYPVEHVDGCCMATRTDVLKSLGLIDEDYFMYREESDYQERVKAAGYSIMETAAPVWHCEEGTTGKYPEMKSYLSMKNTMIFYRRYRSVPMFLCVMFHILLCAIIPHYRTHSIENRRFHAASPLKNIRLFVRALYWNVCDMMSRGYRAKTQFPRL